MSLHSWNSFRVQASSGTTGLDVWLHEPAKLGREGTDFRQEVGVVSQCPYIAETSLRVQANSGTTGLNVWLQPVKLGSE